MTAVPYQHSPLRRLRRLARWLAACGGAPCCGFYHGAACRNDRQYEERELECDRLLGVEIEWACRVAAESIELDWLSLVDLSKESSSPLSEPSLPLSPASSPLSAPDSPTIHLLAGPIGNQKIACGADALSVPWSVDLDAVSCVECSVIHRGSPMLTVTAAELAEALRSLLAASKREVSAVDDAQCLIPEQETVWPERYDIEELNNAHTEESSAREALRNQHAVAEFLISRFDAQQAYLRQQAVAVQQLAEALAKPDSSGCTMELFVGGKRVGVATDVTIDAEPTEQIEPVVLSAVEQFAKSVVEEFAATRSNNVKYPSQCRRLLDAIADLGIALRKRGAP